MIVVPIVNSRFGKTALTVDVVYSFIFDKVLKFRFCNRSFTAFYLTNSFSSDKIRVTRTTEMLCAVFTCFSSFVRDTASHVF